MTEVEVATPVESRRLDRLDVSLIITDPGFRKNLVGDLKRLAYPVKPENIEDAAQSTIASVLNQPNGKFDSKTRLKKWAFEAGRAFLISPRYRLAAHQGVRKERLVIDKGWNTDEAPDHIAGSFDGLVEKQADGRHTLTTITGHGGYEDKEAKKRRLADAKQRREEEAIRTAPSKPVIVRADRGEFVATLEDWDVLGRVTAQRISLPTVAKSKVKRGWAAKGRR